MGLEEMGVGDGGVVEEIESGEVVVGREELVGQGFLGMLDHSGKDISEASFEAAVSKGDVGKGELGELFGERKHDVTPNEWRFLSRYRPRSTTASRT